ncbi:ATP-dependent Clp protease proteolytic subunit [Yersinia sp. Marseille-Q3913]|uniref:ClpP family protease n=1 Tax=Yersinia sp. Marseille-Q3913 TaxID=2830769 RepID=UPI001BAF8658|nr:ATP-dependent Clp protease proteolytic subunit [Yersinia sp. Marseille-Q3913]MBS0055834.1 ATP-dependent Clp protease proteolytic subunit [Yersinia sp. Marseille-Q3913]
MKKIITFCVLTFSASSLATVSVVKNKSAGKEVVAAAKIYYIGDVTEKSVTELISSIDEINANYPTLKHLYLYINSNGGDMDSGYMAYETVRSSRAPITTINSSMVASAATMFYCAAKERLAMPLSSFLLHPASASNDTRKGYLQPNHIDQIKQYVDSSNNVFKNIYKQCTSYNDEDLSKILFSEDSHKLIDANVAIEKKISTAKAIEIERTPVSYYILNEEKSE